MVRFMDAGAEVRLKQYFERIGSVLGNKRRRESFAIYALGLFGDGERKSIEPIAARACADPQGTDSAHQRLLHFATDSPWSDHGVRRAAARYAPRVPGRAALPGGMELSPVSPTVTGDKRERGTQ